MELDTDTLDEFQEDTGRDAVNYWNACRYFWDHAAKGGHGTGMLIRRELLNLRQTDRVGDRSDLTLQLSALDDAPEIGRIVKLATVKDVNWDEVDRLLDGKSSRTTEGNTTILTLRVSGRQAWPKALGGRHSRGELTREFIIEVNHAAWRDRRNRRLVGVKVNAIELWADPEAFTAA